MNLYIPIKFKRLYTAGAVPTTAQLQEGEFSVNFPDKKLYTKDQSGTIQQIGVALSQLAGVATTGSYNDLSDKPNIGSAYILPPATTTVLGGVIVPTGKGLAVDTAGNLSNIGVITINGRSADSSGNIALTGTDVGIPNDLMSAGQVNSKYLPTALAGGLNPQGVWNANTNSPTLASGGVGPAGTQLANGSYYVVSVAGTTSIDGISTWTVGDLALVSNGVWTRLANAGSGVSSVNGQTGIVTITAATLSLAAVATSGKYSDLTGAPGAYTLPPAKNNALGGVIFNPTAQSAGNATTGMIATVGFSGSYNDLLNLPVNSPDVSRIAVNLNGTPNITENAYYIFTQACQFPNNFANSQVFVSLVTGTTTTINLLQYTAANPTVAVNVGAIHINTAGSNTFTSNATLTNFGVGDQLCFQFTDTSVSRLTVTVVGNWQ